MNNFFAIINYNERREKDYKKKRKFGFCCEVDQAYRQLT